MSAMMQMPHGRMPEILDAARPKLAEAAQAVYSDWMQVDGVDEIIGAGGICQDVASAMVGALSEMGLDDAVAVHSTVGENHVFVVALVPGDGVYEIDIPPSVYETGSGFTWRKREAVVIGPDDVCVAKIADDMEPAAFEALYADG